MGMSGGKPPKQKESAAEKLQAEHALKRMEEWKSDGFKDLENASIRDAKKDLTEALDRRASADAAQAYDTNPMGKQVGALQGTLGRDLADNNRGLDAAFRTAESTSRIEAKNLRDRRMTDMAKVGQNVSMTIDNAFTNAASRGASEARAKAENQAAMRNQRLNNIMGVVQGAATGYMLRDEPNLGNNAIDQGVMMRGKNPDNVATGYVPPQQAIYSGPFRQ